MKENWTKDIHDKMTGMEMEEPAGLWDDICAARKEAKVIAMPPRKQASRWSWVKLASSVAAMTALLIAVGMYLFMQNESSVVPPQMANMTEIATAQQHETTAQQNETTALQNETTAQPVSFTSTTPTARKNHTKRANIIAKIDEAGKDEVETNLVDNAVVADKDRKVEINNNDNNVDKEEKEDKNVEQTEKLTSLEEYDPFKGMPLAQNNASRRSRLSFALHSNGATGSETKIQYTSGPASSSYDPNASTNWSGNPLLGILLLNRGSNCVTDYKHHLPIRSGILLSYALNDRLSLESGLSFTQLNSDLRDGTTSNYQSGKQKLSYIGIPVNVNYNLLSWQKFSLIASAGVLAEQCIAASRKWQYSIDNKPTKTEKEDLGTKPFQMSVNGSLGIQYSLSPVFSIYAGPGISYHFDDGTSIETIYKEKPVNFNINCGIRINFNENK